MYKARWEVELLFKELKQTLQLQDFYGENENAVEWQIWAALLTHLVLRWLKYKSGAACSYSRFAAHVRAIVWLKKDAMAILRSYGIAPPPRFRRRRVGNAVFAGVREDVPEGCGIAEWRFCG